MTDRLRVSFAGESDGVVSFGDRFQASQKFDAVFREGMELVERTAAYLDGEGRAASKALKAPLNMVYATESMRLTTRLLDLASWLLIRRALKEGEISEAEAQAKRSKVKLQGVSRPSHIRSFEDLPEGLQQLIIEAGALHDRIVRLDKSFSVGDEVDAAEAAAHAGSGPASRDGNPVAVQQAQLLAAFERH